MAVAVAVVVVVVVVVGSDCVLLLVCCFSFYVQAIVNECGALQISSVKVTSFFSPSSRIHADFTKVKKIDRISSLLWNRSGRHFLIPTTDTVP